MYRNKLFQIGITIFIISITYFLSYQRNISFANPNHNSNDYKVLASINLDIPQDKQRQSLQELEESSSKQSLSKSEASDSISSEAEIKPLISQFQERNSSSNLSEEVLADETQSPFNGKIYNLSLLQANEIETYEPAKYSEIEELIDEIIAEYQIERDHIGLAFYNYISDEHYYINEDTYRIAASTNKLPLAGIYLDLIAEGDYQMDSQIDYQERYFSEGNGNITNGPIQNQYTLANLIYEMLAYSDNTAWNLLGFHYIDHYQSVRQGILDFVGFEDNIPDYYFEDNFASPRLLEASLIKISQNEQYRYILDSLRQISPPQLFTSYIRPKVMPSKFGRYEGMVHDSGIYYEDGQPQYALVVMTDNQANADLFLEHLSLNLNLWFRYHFILNN